MWSAKSIRKDVWPIHHYHLGAIRTEGYAVGAAGTKRTAGDEDKKAPRKIRGAVYRIYFAFEETWDIMAIQAQLSSNANFASAKLI